MIEEWLRFLDQDTKITVRDQDFGFGPSTGYCASSRKGVAELLALGVKGEPVPELYASRHFWRGLIDGDGSIYTSKDGRKPLVVLCSGKLRDIAAFSTWTGRLLGYDGPKPYLAGGGWYARLFSAKARAIAVYLYKNSYSALPRKRDKALSFEVMSFRESLEPLEQEP